MASYKVAPMKKTQIRKLTEDFLKEHFPQHLEDPGLLDVEALIDQKIFKSDKFTLCLINSSDFKTEAEIHPEEQLIEIPTRNWNKMLKGDKRQRFTMAHEAAHFILGHIDQIDKATKTFKRTYNTKLQAYENSEWQAEYGGSCLLMPPITLIPFVRNYARHGINPIELLNAISLAYGVSIEAARLAIKKEDSFEWGIRKFFQESFYKDKKDSKIWQINESF